MKTTDQDYKRTIDELVMLYTNETGIKDVFVEGVTDVGVVDWFLHQHGRTGWQVRTVDAVNIPDEVVLEAGYAVGNRGRVLALGTKLSGERSKFLCPAPICIADRDWSPDIVSDPALPPLCLLTDERSLEMYAFGDECFSRLCRVYLRRDDMSGESLISAITPALVELFALRAAVLLQPDQIVLVDRVFGRLSIVDGKVYSGYPELLRNSLVSLNAHAIDREAEILVQVEAIVRDATGSERNYIRGHDVGEVLSWYLKRIRIRSELVNPAVLSGLLLLLLDPLRIAERPLFAILLERTGA